MKILLVNSSLGAGGGEKQIGLMANYWARKDWKVTFFTFADGSATSPHFRLHPSVRHIPLPFGPKAQPGLNRLKKNYIRLKCLRDEIRKVSPEVIISFGDKTNIAVIFASLFLGIPIIISQRIYPGICKFGFLWDVLNCMAFKLCAGMIVQAERAKFYYSNKQQPKIFVIPNQIIEELHTDESCKIKLLKPAIIAMGRLSPEKRFELLINAFAMIASDHIEWTLYIFGDGALKNQLLTQIDSLGLSNRIFLPGVVKKSISIFRQADIFVSASDYEGFPNALAEAMAIGLPVISTDALTGPRELIQDGINGLIVPRGDKQSLSLAIKRLIINPKDRFELAQKAPSILQIYQPDKVMGIWEDLITNITNNYR